MGLETGTHAEDLNTANPIASDNINQGDDHLRLIKTVLKLHVEDMIGMVSAFAAAPPGATTSWLLCDGSAVSRTTFSALFAVISDDYGAGDGSTTFNLPDYRGYFLRGQDAGAGNDPDAASRTDRGDTITGDAIGTKQADEFKSHTHTYGNTSQDIAQSTGDSVKDAENANSFVTGATGGNETRPKNINVAYYILAK